MDATPGAEPRAQGRQFGDADLRWEIFAALIEATRRSLRNAIDDSYLAALAISQGATLASFDQDFEPFVGLGLRWERPALA